MLYVYLVKVDGVYSVSRSPDLGYIHRIATDDIERSIDYIVRHYSGKEIEYPTPEPFIMAHGALEELFRIVGMAWIPGETGGVSKGRIR